MIVQLSHPQTETMGIFGFSWPEKIAKFMSQQLKGTSAVKKLKSFWSAGGLNVTLVKNLYNDYAALMASGYSPSNFSVAPNTAGTGGTFDGSTISLASKIQQSTNVETAVVLEFLRALYVLARDGKIPYAKWNPAGYQQKTALRQTFATEKSKIAEIAKGTLNYTKLALIAAVVTAGAYLLNKMKK